MKWRLRPIHGNMKPLESHTKEELIALIRRLLVRIEKLEAEVAKLRKNSSNSSKSPSSDIVKPPKPAKRKEKGKWRIGGQPGHRKHEREPFRPEDLDDTRQYTLDRCPDCGGRLRKSRRPDRVVQQVELIERPVEIVEHRSPACWCPSCRRHVYAPLPPAVANGGLIGPHLTALVAYLKGVCHASFSTIRRFFQDVLKVSISRGQLAKLIGKASEALAGGYEALRMCLPDEPRLNVDETGHKENGKTFWTWCFRTQMYTLFKIDGSRGSEVLIETLGREFNGVLGCDYFSAYRKYMTDFNVLVQFCLAHLIRDVKFLTTLRDRATRAYGERVLAGLRRLFRVIQRRETMSQAQFQRALGRARQALLAVARRAPSRAEAQNLAKRFREHGNAYFRFITTPGVEPTNNLAEQAIRFVVIDRRITQGTRSVKGRRWCERIWTVLATCAQQGRSAFAYLRDAIYAYFQRHPAPLLLPIGV